MILNQSSNESFCSFNISVFRWLSALAVVIMHATALLISQPDIMTAPHNAFEYFWWFISDKEVGHKAVVGFFVISGYLVGGPIIIRYQQGNNSNIDYYIDRFSRIYIVLIPAILFTLIIDSIGVLLFNAGNFYNNPMFHGHYGSAVLVLNLLSLQNMLSEPYGSNIPLWSLSLEVWYYLTFPVFVKIFLEKNVRQKTIYRFVPILLTCVYFSIKSYFFFWGYIFWIAGAVCAVISRPILNSYWLSFVIFLLVAIPIRLLVRGQFVDNFPNMRTASDMLCAIAFMNLLLTARFCDQLSMKTWLFNNLTMPNFTFSLYITHLPIIVFIRAQIDDYSPGWALQNALFSNWLLLFGALTLTILVAYVFSLFTELQTPLLRNYLRRNLVYQI